MKRYVLAASAAALSISLMAGVPAWSQAELAAEAMEKATMLGVDLTDVVLTEEQVLEIENVLNSDDEDASKTEMINQIIAE